jgi:hypothetical protein
MFNLSSRPLKSSVLLDCPMACRFLLAPAIFLRCDRLLQHNLAHYGFNSDIALLP